MTKTIKLSPGAEVELAPGITVKCVGDGKNEPFLTLEFQIPTTATVAPAK